MTKFLLLLIISLSSLNAKERDCPISHGKYGNQKMYQEVGCIIRVDGHSHNNTSRQISVNGEGKLMIFSSFPKVGKNRSDGSRVFFLLPFRTIERIEAKNSEHLLLQHQSGVRLKFDKNGHLSSASPELKIKVDETISPDNKGGFEILNYSKGLVIDLGWAHGDPVDNLDGPLEVTDKNGSRCRLANRDLFTISPKSRERVLKYNTNQKIYNFLKNSCPKLDISDLLEKVVPTQMLEAIKDEPKTIKNNSPVEVYQGARDDRSLDELIDRISTENLPSANK